MVQQESSDNMMPNEMTMSVEIVRTEHKLHSNNNKASLNVELNFHLIVGTNQTNNNDDNKSQIIAILLFVFNSDIYLKLNFFFVPFYSWIHWRDC